MIVGLAAFGFAMVGDMPVALAAAIMVLGHAAAAIVAGLTARTASRGTSGVSRRVWALFGVGLAFWTAGCVAYLAFLAMGGSPESPAAWTQIGFLGAYVPWYRALWLMRQPVLARSRRQRVESVLIEFVALGLIGLVLGAALWNEVLTPGQNLVLLLPGVLDLLLLAGLYNAVRRSALSFDTAHGWLALGFLTLGATDIAVTALVPRGQYEVAGLIVAGYAVTMGFVGTAATRPLHISETQHGVGRSSVAVGLLSLALVAPAAALLPADARWGAWGVGGALLMWLWSHLARESVGDFDALTGTLRPEAFERHLSGVLALARDDRPAGLLMVEVRGLADWTAEHGFLATDNLVKKIGCALEEIDLPEGGVWSNIAPGRFAWLGVMENLEGGRRLAHRACGAAATSGAPLDAFCGVALVPGDADTPDDALAAAHEAAQAARDSRRQVVAFDRGHLDGIPSGAGYTTSLRARRARIEDLIATTSLLESVFQPIVALGTMEVRGYEALSRFLCDPRQGPDIWIAEAHTLGLGVELEAECVRRALAHRDRMPPGRYMSLNAGPELLLSSTLDEILAGHSLHGIVFEITEHHHVSDYAELASRLALLRGRGARVAIDDVGAGHSSMRHVMNLRPDVIKVDRWIVSDIGIDSGKRALLRSFVALSEELGADLVVEGVETLDELAVLHELGAPMAQGFLFARPAPEFVDLRSDLGPTMVAGPERAARVPAA